MNKFILFAALFAMFQLATSTTLKCDKTKLDDCKKEVGRLLDRDVKVATSHYISRIVRRYIDVSRELIRKDPEDKTLIEQLSKKISDLKTQLDMIHEKWQNDEEVVKIIFQLGDLMSNASVTDSKNETIDIIQEDRVKENLLEAFSVLIQNILFEMGEINEDLKEQDIKLDDVTPVIDDLLTSSNKNELEDVEFSAAVIEALVDLTKKLDNMRFTKEIFPSAPEERMF